MSEARSQFDADGYAPLPGLVAASTCEFLHNYALRLAKSGNLEFGDEQEPGTPFRYADPFMESLLERLRPRIEAESGLALYPTYSYFRIYKRGDSLERHEDRPSCEISVTLNLGQQVTEAWPIWLESKGAPVALCLEPGDGLLYRGMDVSHWREAFTGEHMVQVFLHYVDQDGPYREWRFDKRSQLTTLTPVDRIMQQFV